MARKRFRTEPDTRIIDIDDQHALDYWTTELRVTEVKLKAVITVAGSVVSDVKRELKK